MSSLYDKGYKNLEEKEAVKPDSYTQTKKFHIDGKKLWLHLFTRDELEKEFAKHGFILDEFTSVFRGVMPRWNFWKRFSLLDRLQLALDRFKPVEFGAMYLMVFKNSNQR